MSDDRIIPVIMPKWGLSMTEGKLTGWLIDEGTDIAVGDEIMEVETDKITNVVEATDAGLLRRHVAAAGTTHPIRALLGVLAPPEISDDAVAAFVEAFEAPQPSDEDNADAGPQYEFAETPAGRLRYAVRGDSGPVIVLIHGFGGDLDNWLFNIDALARNATVYALDLPGHGQSVKSVADGGLPGLARSLEAFMDAVGIEAAHLVGHSMGAAVAATLAITSPDRVSSLCLISAAGLGPQISSAYIDGFVAASTRRELKPVLQTLFDDPSMVTRAMVDDLLKYRRLDGVQEALSRLALDLFAGGMQDTVLAGEIAALEARSLVVWGQGDQVIPAAHAQNLPGAQVAVLEGAGHMVQMEKATQVNELILGHIFS
ncbi:Dihydrolipoamide acetyltransferase component (E2) of acetoin dehydrogenase complex [hydrothermal vent metagenome]|uniref:Dihydrolipoamide acetyltransferase component (E2) of acetoin dehydrogenase complex n=1 Tax=hydrothermal vent metagenome TaxID=652676 RepID=A0A3B0TXH7_9ZZZZ